MSKNGQRSNKEKKKPKQVKSSEASTVSPFAKGQVATAKKAK